MLLLFLPLHPRSPHSGLPSVRAAHGSEASPPPRGRLCAPTPSLGGLDRAGQAGHLAPALPPGALGRPCLAAPSRHPRPAPAPRSFVRTSLPRPSLSPPPPPARPPPSLPPASLLSFLLCSPPGGLPGGGGGSSSAHPPGLARTGASLGAGAKWHASRAGRRGGDCDSALLFLRALLHPPGRRRGGLDLAQRRTGSNTFHSPL